MKEEIKRGGKRPGSGRKEIPDILKSKNRTIRLNQLEVNLFEKFGIGKNLTEKIKYLVMKGLENLEIEGQIEVTNESLGTPFEKVLEGLGKNLIDYKANPETEEATFIVKKINNISEEIFFLLKKYNWELEEK